MISGQTFLPLVKLTFPTLRSYLTVRLLVDSWEKGSKSMQQNQIYSLFKTVTLIGRCDDFNFDDLVILLRKFFARDHYYFAILLSLLLLFEESTARHSDRGYRESHKVHVNLSIKGSFALDFRNSDICSLTLTLEYAAAARSLVQLTFNYFQVLLQQISCSKLQKVGLSPLCMLITLLIFLFIHSNSVGSECFQTSLPLSALSAPGPWIPLCMKLMLH